MNLVQLGTTASRANREKSVKKSIAQGNVQGGYVSNRYGGQLDSRRNLLGVTLKVGMYGI